MPEGLPGRGLPRYSADLVACRIYHSVDQIIGNSVATGIAFDSVEYDFGGFYLVRDGLVRIPYSGLYAVTAHLRWSANTTNQRLLRVFRNPTAASLAAGTGVILSSFVNNFGAANAPRHGDYVELILEGGDIIQPVAFQDSGGNLTLVSQFAIDGLVPVVYPSMTVRLITKL